MRSESKGLLSLILLGLVLFLAAAQLSAAAAPASTPGDRSAALNTRLQNLEREVKSLGSKADLYESALSAQTGMFSLIVAGLLAGIGLVSWLSFRIELKQAKKDLVATVTQLDKKLTTLETEFAQTKGRMSGIGSNLYQIISEHHEEKGNLAEAFRFSLISATTRYEYLRASHDANTKSAALESLTQAVALIRRVHGDIDATKALRSSNQGVLESLSRLEAGDEEEVKDICAEIRLKFKEVISRV